MAKDSAARMELGTSFHQERIYISYCIYCVCVTSVETEKRQEAQCKDRVDL